MWTLASCPCLRYESCLLPSLLPIKTITPVEADVFLITGEWIALFCACGDAASHIAAAPISSDVATCSSLQDLPPPAHIASQLQQLMEPTISLDRELLHDTHALPIDNALRDVLREADRVADEVVHERYPEREPLLPKKFGAPSLATTSPFFAGGGARAVGASRVLRHEAKRIGQLFLPLFLSYMAETLASTSLSMMIGHTAIGADTHVLAALSLTSMYPTMLTGAVIGGIGSAVSTLCTQAFGGRRITELWLFFQAGVLVTALFMPLMIVITAISAPVLNLMGQDPEIVEKSKPILFALASSLPPLAISTLLQCVMCAQGIAVPVMLASIIAWAMSTPIVLWLAFHTSLGYVAIGMSTTALTTVKCLVLAVAMIRSEGYREEWPGWNLHAALKIGAKMKSLVGSGTLLTAFTTAGVATFSIITGMLPKAAVVVTASGIYLSVITFALVPQYALSDSSTTRIGNALGSGDGYHAWVTTKLVIVVSFVIGVAQTAGMNAIATPFANVFTSDAEAAQLAATMIRQLSPLMIASSVAAGGQGALIAMGKQFVSAIACFVCVVAVGVPCGLWFAISLDGGLVGLWYGNVVGFTLCALVQLVWLYRVDWDEVARDAKEQTEVDPAVDHHSASVAIAA